MISWPGWGVPDEWRVRTDVDARLDDLASGKAEIVLLEVGVLDSFRLLGCRDAPSFNPRCVKPRVIRQSWLSVLPDYRSDLKAARTSSENSSGSSQAAKWPPLSTSLK
jgi:hypothetical protein